MASQSGVLMRKTVSLLLPDLSCGGAERVAVTIANEMAARGYDVELVLMSAKGELLGDLRPDVRLVDLEVKRFRHVLVAMIRYLRCVRPDALLACMWPLTVVALWARALSGTTTRVVIAEHTTWSSADMVKSTRVRWQVRSTMHQTFTRADAIIAVSHGAADDLASFAALDRETITVVYNPVGRAGRSPLVTPSGIDAWWTGAHRKVLAVGRLKPEKDYITLLKAFVILRQRVEARLLILGEGECRRVLETEATRLDIASDVYMPGYAENPSPYYQHADLHVLSSTAEGLPTVIIEALAEGTPVVSTDCPSGPREILCGGQHGLLVPPGDAAALAAAMEQSLMAAHDHVALKARAQDFAVADAVDKYEDLLFPRSTAIVG